MRVTGLNDQDSSSSDEEDQQGKMPFIQDPNMMPNSYSSSQSDSNMKYL